MENETRKNTKEWKNNETSGKNSQTVDPKCLTRSESQRSLIIRVMQQQKEHEEDYQEPLMNNEGQPEQQDVKWQEEWEHDERKEREQSS